MSVASETLERLVGAPRPFLDEVFGRRPLHVPAVDGHHLDELLTLDDVDHLLAATGLRAPSFRLVRDGETLPRSRVTRRVRIGSRPVDDLVDVAAVQREFAAGASIVLQGLHRSFAPVAELSRSLEVALTHPVQANAYLTPPVAQGLHLHADPHDVFAIQTDGVKRWVVHPPDEDQPWDLDLRAGDVLYLPAGTRHAAQTVDQPSLHLTIGVRTTRWADLVRRTVDAALEDTDLDDTLPAGWADDPRALLDGLRARVAELSSALQERDLASSSLETASRSFWRNRPPDLRGGLRDVLEVGGLDDRTRVQVRAAATCHLHEAADGLRVVLGDRSLTVPRTLRPTLERIAELGRFRPADLDDLIDEASRLVLCRRLVREGLLTIDRTSEPARG